MSIVIQVDREYGRHIIEPRPVTNQTLTPSQQTKKKKTKKKGQAIWRIGYHLLALFLDHVPNGRHGHVDIPSVFEGWNNLLECNQ